MIKSRKRFSFIVAIVGLLSFAGCNVLVADPYYFCATLCSSEHSARSSPLRRVSTGSGILTVLRGINHHLETAGLLVGACGGALS